MTPAERVDPDIIDESRRNRIAAGSGAEPAQVSELLKQFREVSKMMKRMGGLGSKRMKKARKGKKGGKQAEGPGHAQGQALAAAARASTPTPCRRSKTSRVAGCQGCGDLGGPTASADRGPRTGLA